MNNEPVAYACQIVEADFDTSIIKIEMLDKHYKVSAGIKFLCDEYTHPAKTLEPDCYGDGNVYRGVRSKDSAIQTIHIDSTAKTLTDEEIIEVHINTPFIDGYLNKNLISFARAILRKAQEK